MKFKHPQNQIARWLEELSQYNMRIVHRPGRKHLNADALSRDIPDTCQSYSTKVRLEDLPCGGCRYCHRAHERWHEFDTEVDDVIPLSQLFQESPGSVGNQSAVESNFEVLSPTLRQAIVSDTWDQAEFNMFTVEHFLENPDVQVFDKLKKDELLSLGSHLGLEVKSSMKKQEIRTVVAKKLLAENIFYNI